MKLKTTLKATLVMLICLAFFSLKSGATIFTVNVSNFQFSPSSISNVVVGDTIHWVRLGGTHTTTSSSIPVGAATWDSDLNGTTTSFDYKVTVEGVYNYVCVPHQAFGMVASFTVAASGPLPVRLSGFNIANENNKAVIKWITQSEENIDYFSVQKSGTGADFSEIAKVPAAGHSSSVRSYTYTDLNLSSADKFYYYMIVSVDKDGQKQFSPVQLFRNSLNTAKLILSISPNPVSQSGHLMLKFNADKTGELEVNVTNMEGRSVIKTVMQAYEGVNNGHLMLDGLPPGVYSIIFKLNNVRETHQLIVK